MPARLLLGPSLWVLLERELSQAQALEASNSGSSVPGAGRGGGLLRPLTLQTPPRDPAAGSHPGVLGSGWAVLLCTLSADKGKKILPQSHSLVQAIETNVPQKTQYPLTLAPSTDHQPPSERSLAQDKCHTDLLGEVAQQLTHGTNRGVTQGTSWTCAGMGRAPAGVSVARGGDRVEAEDRTEPGMTQKQGNRSMCTWCRPGSKADLGVRLLSRGL